MTSGIGESLPFWLILLRPATPSFPLFQILHSIAQTELWSAGAHGAAPLASSGHLLRQQNPNRRSPQRSSHRRPQSPRARRHLQTRQTRLPPGKQARPSPHATTKSSLDPEVALTRGGTKADTGLALGPGPATGRWRRTERTRTARTRAPTPFSCKTPCDGPPAACRRCPRSGSVLQGRKVPAGGRRFWAAISARARCAVNRVVFCVQVRGIAGSRGARGVDPSRQAAKRPASYCPCRGFSTQVGSMLLLPPIRPPRRDKIGRGLGVRGAFGCADLLPLGSAAGVGRFWEPYL